MGQIPPDETHPLYQEWLAAKDQYLAAMKKLVSLSAASESSPEFVAARSRMLEALAKFEAVGKKISGSPQAQPDRPL